MHWRFAVILILFAVIVGLNRTERLQGQGVSSEDIALTVNEWSNIARTNEPVTTGIPITPSQTGLSWSLFDGQTEIPVQTTVLPGIKTPWLLLDFQTSLTANQTKALTLRPQTSTANPVQPLVINQTASQITVGTGPVQTQISLTNYNLFETVWRDQDADGVFEVGEEVVNPSANNLSVTDTSVPNGGTGLVYTPSVNPADVTWEYQGPLRATLRVDGSYVNNSSALPDQTLVKFTTRITWYAGQPFVKVDHVIRNSFQGTEHWPKVASAKVNIGTGTTTYRIAKSGDFIWSNQSGGTSVELIPATLDVTDTFDPLATPYVPRTQYQPLVNVDSNGGMIIGDQSYHGATLQLDFSTTLAGAEATRRTTAAQDPLITFAPEARYSELSAFGAEHFGSYTDEKNSYTKWGWSWPTPGNPWSDEHSRPRVQDMYLTWSTTEAGDFEADELWQNIVMLARVQKPFYLDRSRSYARYWNWEWTPRSDGYAFDGVSWHWNYGNGTTRTPAVQPTLSAIDTDFINLNIKLGKANTTHNWNGGSFDYYYLTGEKDSLQAGIDLAEQCKLGFYGPNYAHTPQNTGVSGTGSRYVIRCLFIFLRTWEATNDQQWKTAADGMLPFFLQSPNYDQRGFFHSTPCTIPEDGCAGHESGKSFAGFPSAVAVEALYRYYVLTGHTGVRTQLLQIAQFMRDNGYDPVTGIGGSYYIVDSPSPGNVIRTIDIYGNRSTRDFVNTLVIGYRLTGDATYLNQAKWAWKRGSSSISGNNHALDSQVGRWENSLQSWDPYSSLFPEGGDLTYASLLFYDAARQDTTAPSSVINLLAY